MLFTVCAFLRVHTLLKNVVCFLPGPLCNRHFNRFSISPELGFCVPLKTPTLEGPSVCISVLISCIVHKFNPQEVFSNSTCPIPTLFLGEKRSFLANILTQLNVYSFSKCQLWPLNAPQKFCNKTT